MKHIRKFNEGFRDLFKSKEQKRREELFGTKNLSKKIEIGDKVMVISLEGNPTGEVYDITGNSYWVDLEKFGKMEFSDFELKVLV
jgi:ribosomal protein L21E